MKKESITLFLLGIIALNLTLLTINQLNLVSSAFANSSEAPAHVYGSETINVRIVDSETIPLKLERVESFAFSRAIPVKIED